MWEKQTWWEWDGNNPQIWNEKTYAPVPDPALISWDLGPGTKLSVQGSSFIKWGVGTISKVPPAPKRHLPWFWSNYPSTFAVIMKQQWSQHELDSPHSVDLSGRCRQCHQQKSCLQALTSPPKTPAAKEPGGSTDASWWSRVLYLKEH